jgi:hypothetical protein
MRRGRDGERCGEREVDDDARGDGRRAPLAHPLVRAHERQRRKEVTQGQGGAAEQRAVEWPAGRCRHHRTAQRNAGHPEDLGRNRAPETEDGRDRVNGGEHRRDARKNEQRPSRSGGPGKNGRGEHERGGDQVRRSPGQPPRGVSRRGGLSLAHALGPRDDRVVGEKDEKGRHRHEPCGQDARAAGRSSEDDRNREHHPRPVLAREGRRGGERHVGNYEPASRLIAPFASFARSSSGKRRAYSS